MHLGTGMAVKATKGTLSQMSGAELSYTSLANSEIGVADFEMRGTDFFVSLPYVRQEYRKKGIGLEIYKIILTFGGLVSGKAQSEQAVALWKKMYQVLPNKMTFVDDSGKEFDVELIDNDLVYGDEKESVYKDRGGYLKLYQNENSNN